MQLTYNNVVLEMVKTNEISFEAIYTQDNQDYLYTRCYFDVQATVNPEAMAYVVAAGTLTATPGTLPTTTVKAIRHFLTQPGMILAVTDFSGQTMLQVPADGQDTDVKGGPYPRVLQVISVNGSKTFLVRFTVEAFIVECPPGTDAPALISNRWSDQHVINQYHMCTRTAAGKAVFRQDFLKSSGQTPDDFRNVLFPDIAPGFQRTNVTVMEASDGNSLAWQVVDEEKMYDLGETDARTGSSGIVRIDGDQGVRSITMGEGLPCGETMNELHLRAYGNKYSNQWTMIQRLFSLTLTIIPKLAILGQAVIQNVGIRRSLGSDDKWVELTIQVRQLTVKEAQVGGLDLATMEFDVGAIFTPQGGVNPNLPNDTGSRGSSIAQLVVSGLLEACGTPPEAGPPGTGETGSPPPPQGPPPAVNVIPVETLPPFTTNYADPPGGAPITMYTMNMNWIVDTGLIQCPVAGGGPTGTGSGPPPTSAVFRLRQPTSQLIVEGECESLYSPPMLPTMDPNDTNVLLLEGHVVPSSPVVVNDGVTAAYRVRFWYKFALLGAFDPTAPLLAMGKLPWTSLTFNSSFLTPDNFISGIIDPGTS